MDAEKKRNQFWKKISMDLRTPLAVIKGTADISRTEIYDVNTVKEGFEMIGQSSEFLLDVVNDIVDFVTIENNDLEIQNAPFDLRSLIEEITTEYYIKAKRQNKYFDVQICDLIHENISGDEHRIQQILECMLQNTFKYTSIQDRLYFKICEIENKYNKVHLRFSMTSTSESVYEYLCGTVNGKVVTSVTDLFLYNSHYILNEMGGEIRVELDENGFSVIIIDIETDCGEVEKCKSNVEENSSILIISDQMDMAKNRGALLSELGIDFDIATEYEEALEMIGAADASHHPYTLCIVDWDITSFALREWVVEAHHIFGQELLVVVMAYDSENMEEEAMQQEFDYVMSKVWFRSTILELLDKKEKGELQNFDDMQFRHKLYDFENKRVLVAEDTPLNMDVIIRILSRVNLDVVCAVDGVEAYTLYRQKPDGYFDCILLDIQMPRMDGYETAKRIRKSDKSDAQSIPIYALTSNAFEKDRKASIFAGMNGHFTKPIDINILYSTLNSVFSDETRSFQIKVEKAKETDVSDEVVMYDTLTGLLNSNGFEQKIRAVAYCQHPLGCLLLEIDHFEILKDTYNHKQIKDIMIKIADFLTELFLQEDLIVRWGEYQFLIALVNCDKGLDFIAQKVKALNKSLINLSNDSLRVTMSAGAAFSSFGYSTRLLYHTEYALYHAKNMGNSAYYALDTDVKMLNETRNCDFLHKMALGTELFYTEQDSIFDIDNMNEILPVLLGSNQAIGIICGTYDEGLPISSISGFALDNLGYDIESFQRETQAKLNNIVFWEDLSLLNMNSENLKLESKQLRFNHKNRDLIWFNLTYMNVKNENGTAMWIATLRPLDDNIVGMLCNADYKTVSIVFPKENTILLEKGIQTTYVEKLQRRKKYNYDSLIQNVLVKMHKESERDEYLRRTSMSNLVSQINRKGLYEFISYQQRENGACIPIRYKYRYIDEEKNLILWTQEYVDLFAEYDDVTSLWNENGFLRKVKEILLDKENSKKEYSILYFNIKNFKSWNELLGNTNADELLRMYANRLDRSPLKPLCSARFRADQFWILLERENLDYDQLVEICHGKLMIKGNTVNVHSNCGIYHIKERKQKVSIMCDKAVLAEGYISNEYATPYHVYNEKVAEQYRNHLFVFNNMDRAFAKDEFQVYYQPVCDTKTGKICSAEALIRWVMPGGKVVSPGVFIPILENKGYISRLDLLVVDRVQRFLEKRYMNGKNNVPVSINLSRMDFLNDDFLHKLREKIENISMDSRLMRYEVTESAYINVGEDGKRLLEELRKRKAQIYMDDFGTGYSSLQNLMETYFDVLKLDMYFIRKIGSNDIAEGVIKSAVQICHELGRKVIAEGVETKEQHEFLIEKDCDYIQGFYFYKPMTESEFEEVLDRADM